MPLNLGGGSDFGVRVDGYTSAPNEEMTVFYNRVGSDYLRTLGLYGVIAAAVAQRTPEIGMRIALGASRSDIMALVLKQGLAVTVIGAGFGIVGAAGLTRLFKSQLVGVGAMDAMSYAGMTTLLVAVALIATYLPARRAASVDPLTALRND